MATVTTTTITDSIAVPGNAPIVRSYLAGSLDYLFVAVRTATDTLTIYRSTNSGSSWSSYSTYTHTGLAEWSSLFIDFNGFMNLAYRVSTTGGGGTDTIWYVRMRVSNGSWSSPLQTSGSDSNGGTAGATWQGVDIACVRNPNGSMAIAVAGARTQGTTRYGVTVMGVSVTEDGSIYLNNNIVSTNRSFWISGTAPGRSGVSIDIEHTGNGFSGSTPNLWLTWGRNTTRMVKMTWKGSAQGWQGPSSDITLRATNPTSLDAVAGRWDGARWMVPIPSPDDTTRLRIYQRNQANTATITIDTPVHPQGTIRRFALSYDFVTRNLRAFAVGTSTDVLYYVDYVRQTASWTSWLTVVASAVSSSGQEWGVRRGGSSDNARIDIITNSGASSPFTVTHTAQTVSTAPAIARFDYSAVPYLNGGAADVAATLTLNWIFSDQDPGQTQGSYAISRQIGVGTLAYWNATSSTWVASEVQNSSTTPSVTFASAWASGTDDPYTFRVKVWDSTGLTSAGYSDALQLTPSVKVNPTIVTPVAASTITSDTVTMTWTVAEETAIRVTLFDTTNGVFLHDSGKINYTGTSYTVPVRVSTGTACNLSLWTYNNEGLASTQQTRAFNVAYAVPPAVTSTFVPSTTLGTITVTPVVLAPVGAQPAIVDQDLWRREATTPVLNPNPSMDGNITGWAYGGGGTPGTLSYSTTQSHDGPGSVRYVPNAAGSALPQVEQATYIDIVPGQLYYASAWMRPDTVNKPLVLLINYYTAGLAFISSITYVMSNIVAGGWHFLEFYADPGAVPTATKLRVAVGESSTPAAVDAFYADEIKIEVYNPDLGVRLKQDSAPGASYPDWGPRHGVEHEYRWITTGANGTTGIGPWTS